MSTTVPYWAAKANRINSTCAKGAQLSPTTTLQPWSNNKNILSARLNSCPCLNDSCIYIFYLVTMLSKIPDTAHSTRNRVSTQRRGCCPLQMNLMNEVPEGDILRSSQISTHARSKVPNHCREYNTCAWSRDMHIANASESRRNNFKELIANDG
jgi:hypothetical protein